MARCLEFGADLPIYKWSRETIKGSPDAKRAGLLSLAGRCFSLATRRFEYQSSPKTTFRAA
jgi:hypothetical protein